MARISKDIVKQHKPGGNWYENFTTVDGVRHRESLNTTDQAEARAVAGQRLERGNLIARGVVRREDLRQAVTLAAAHDHYEVTHARKKPSRLKNHNRCKGLLEAHLGRAKILATISKADLAGYIGWRLTHHVKKRGRLVPITARTINIDLAHLRAVMNVAAEDLGADIPDLPWTSRRGKAGLMLDTVRPPRDILDTPQVEADLRRFMSDDLCALFDAAIATSKRWSELAKLTWSGVRRREGVVEIDLGKKKNGADRLQLFPLAAIDDILARVKGQHPAYVFTYLCRTTRRSTKRVQGQRYPWNQSILRDRWSEARAAAMAAGIMDWMSWHRATRATAITRAYTEENPAIAQELAGHVDGATTRMYLGGAALDVNRALTRAKEARLARDGKLKQVS